MALSELVEAPLNLEIDIDTAERRMTSSLYDHWDGLRGDDLYPSRRRFSVEALPSLVDYGFTFVLDATGPGDEPVYQFLGSELIKLVRTDLKHRPMSETPDGSVMAAVVERYHLVLERKAPVYAESELVDSWGRQISYRTTMLPFSENGVDIDCIVGAITFRQELSQPTSGSPASPPPASPPPASAVPRAASEAPGSLDRDRGPEPTDAALVVDLPREPARTGDAAAQPVKDNTLAAGLEECRSLAAALQDCRGKSRAALYHTLERAYRFHLEALPDMAAYSALCAEAGITLQERAPFTGLAKLVFGQDYEKTRISEYATCLAYAHRLGRKAGEVSALITGTEGGIKGCVKAERTARRGETGKRPDGLAQARELLRSLEPVAELPYQAKGNEEFVLLLARRDPQDKETVRVVACLQEKPTVLEPLLKRAAKALKPGRKTKA